MAGIGGLLGTLAGAMIPIPGLNVAAATMLGGALGGALDGNKETNGGAGVTNQTQSRDPWAVAQPYMKQGLENTSALEKYFQKTPFNPMQIQGYSNLFGDIGNFRENVMPGLMNFANAGMTGGYQRGGSTLPAFAQQAQKSAQGGTPQGPFSARQPQGLLDLNGPQYNPHAAMAASPVTPAIQQPVDIPPAVLQSLSPDLLAELGWDWQNTGA